MPRERRLPFGGHSSNVAPRSCTVGERPPTGVVPLRTRGPITASAARRAHAARLRVLPPPERQPAQWRLRVGYAKAGGVLEVAALTSRHGLAPKERGLSPVQCPSIPRRPKNTTSAARRASVASSRVLPPSERQPGQWRARACRAKAGCVLEATARTSHHGLAQKEIGLPPVQCPSIARMAIAASAAWRARAASSRVSPPPERQTAQWR